MTPVALPELPEQTVAQLAELVSQLAFKMPPSNEYTPQFVQLSILLKRAILAERAAERERAALIAEKHRDYVAGVSVGGLIAAAIRNQP